jgi:hypothetical protein
MGFGTGKNNVYMFNPNDAQLTVRLVREDGTSRTIAQSVMTRDKDVKMPCPDILEKLIAADNVQSHPNYSENLCSDLSPRNLSHFHAIFTLARG